MDLVAAYLRTIDRNLQFRVDFLDLSEVPAMDLYIAIDYQPNGSTLLPFNQPAEIYWDLLLDIPADGEIQCQISSAQEDGIQSGCGIPIHVTRDPILDIITVQLSIPNERSAQTTQVDPLERLIRAPFSFQIFITQPKTGILADRTDIVRSDAVPPDPVPVMFVFWNSYPAYTPALALRRWDGAHTGPEGGRHGLFNLLRTFNAAGIPLVLLDLNTPNSISALSYGNNLSFIQDMAKSGSLILPEAVIASNILPVNIPSQLLGTIHQENLSVQEAYTFPPTRSIYYPLGLASFRAWISGGGQVATEIIFQPTSESGKQIDYLPGSTSIYTWLGYRVIPVPSLLEASKIAEQASQEGPTLDLKRILIESALEGDNHGSDRTKILLLGGDLPTSSWGIPQASRASLRYISSRPWIYPLDFYDLLGFPTTSGSPMSEAAANSSPVIDWDLLSNLPQNLISTATWQAFMALYAPVSPQTENLTGLRAHYMNQINILNAASNWGEEPYNLSSCEQDLGKDGRIECILASTNILLVIDRETSAITHAFGRGPDGGLHQFIAPSSQFITGLSNPSTWNLANNLTADPAVIPGAFSNTHPPDRFILDSQAIYFEWDRGDIQRLIYRLLPDRLEIEFLINKDALPKKTILPVALDPWLRYYSEFPGNYTAARDGTTWRFWTDNSFGVAVNSSALINPVVFTDSLEFMAAPENPNQDYPPGHYLPFPMALLEIRSDQDPNLWIEIDLQY